MLVPPSPSPPKPVRFPQFLPAPLIPNSFDSLSPPQPIDIYLIPFLSVLLAPSGEKWAMTQMTRHDVCIRIYTPTHIHIHTHIPPYYLLIKRDMCHLRHLRHLCAISLIFCAFERKTHMRHRSTKMRHHASPQTTFLKQPCTHQNRHSVRQTHSRQPKHPSVTHASPCVTQSPVVTLPRHQKKGGQKPPSFY